MPRPMFRTRHLLILLTTLALMAGACSTSTGSSNDAGGSSDEDEVVLQGVDTVEIDPFTDSVAITQLASFSTASAAAVTAALSGFDAAADAMRTIPGDAPGLYGGTGDDATCDLGQLNDYLADPANADKATAFAKVLGIEVSGIDETLEEFTTVIVNVDLFVTNHGFSGGEANAFVAVLQAGTAVAVDRHGVPRVKCACGNPLAPAPAGVVFDADTPTTGTPWSGWDPAAVAVPEASDEPVDAFDLIDVETGGTQTVPAGGSSSTGIDEVDECVTDADGHGPDCGTQEGSDPTDATAPATAAPTTAAGTGDPEDRSWGVTGGAATADADFRVECAPNGRFEPVYGSGPYEISSSVCTAAVHAGVITRERGGMVTIRAVTDGGPMGADTANGVTTEPTGNPRGFFDFV